MSVVFLARGSLMNHHPIDHFLTISYVYCLMTEKTSGTVADEELLELIIAIDESQNRELGAVQNLG